MKHAALPLNSGISSNDYNEAHPHLMNDVLVLIVSLLAKHQDPTTISFALTSKFFLRFLVHFHCLVSPSQYRSTPKAKFCEASAALGHFELSQWGFENNCGLDEATVLAAFRHPTAFPFLKWAMSLNPLRFITGDMMREAAKHGHVDAVRWLLHQGAPWTSATFFDAAIGGNLELLKWAKENQLMDVGRHFEMAQCAKNGNLELIQWMKDNGYNIFGAVIWAARGGHVHTLEWCKHDASLWNDLQVTLAIFAAVEEGHLEVLKWLKRQEKEANKSDTNLCSMAALKGHLEILKWLRENGYEWNENVCSRAASNNHFDLLKWARSNGCPWYAIRICCEAAMIGNLEMLKWTHEKGGLLEDNICAYAVWYQGEGVREILDWLNEVGCPLTSLTRYATQWKNARVLAWSAQHGTTQHGYESPCNYFAHPPTGRSTWSNSV
jgi:hypothetical protein